MIFAQILNLRPVFVERTNSFDGAVWKYVTHFRAVKYFSNRQRADPNAMTLLRGQAFKAYHSSIYDHWLGICLLQLHIFVVKECAIFCFGASLLPKQHWPSLIQQPLHHTNENNTKKYSNLALFRKIATPKIFRSIPIFFEFGDIFCHNLGTYPFPAWIPRNRGPCSGHVGSGSKNC